MDMARWIEFARQNNISAMRPGSFSDFNCDWRMGSNGYFATVSDYVRVVSKRIGSEYVEPEGVDWGHIILSLKKFKLSDFKNVPACDKLALEDCNVRSLEGIERYSSGQLTLVACNKNGHKPGLLRVLRAPNVKKFVISDSFNLAVNVSIRLHDIMNRHLAERNVADCMDDLIANGFKDFAKM
jgi:hypothetical protein